MSARTRWLLWLPVLAVLAWLVATDRAATPSKEIADAMPRRATPAAKPAAATRAVVTVRELVARDRLVPRRQVRAAPHDLFAARSWLPPPLPPARPVAVAGPPPAPLPEPAPYSYLGKRRDEQGWQIYLAQGDRAVIAREGDTLDDGWRIVSIKPPTLTLARGQQPHQHIAIGNWE